MEYNATVTHRTDVAPGLIILRVAPDKPDFRFQAGQYTVLGLKRSAARIPEAGEEEPPDPKKADPEKLILRAYSIASSSREGEYLEFYLTLVSSGALTPRLFALKSEDRVYVGPKATGMFTLDRVSEGFNILLVGTGTGLAPYMSMLRSQLVCGATSKFVVLHGARYSWDLGYRSELEGLARRCSNFTYLPTVSRPAQDGSWVGLTGYLQDILFSGVIEKEAGLELNPENLHIFLCGNPGMMDAAKARLVEYGFVPDKGRVSGNLHIEEYW